MVYIYIYTIFSMEQPHKAQKLMACHGRFGVSLPSAQTLFRTQTARACACQIGGRAEQCSPPGFQGATCGVGGLTKCVGYVVKIKAK